MHGVPSEPPATSFPPPVCCTPPPSSRLPVTDSLAASTGTGQHKSEDEKDVVSLVETLALGSVGESTQKNYLGKWNVCMAERKAQERGPWLRYDPSAPNQPGVVGNCGSSWLVGVTFSTTSSRP